MANQIGLFFGAQSEDEPAVAAQAVAGHLKLFWAPSMRSGLVAMFDRGEATGLLPIVVRALETHRSVLLGNEVHVRAEAREVFPEGGGDAG